jgi:uncharacterized membrane protein (DUF485 family)
MSKNAHQILEDPEFKELVSKKNSFSMILTVIEFVLYFGFISLIAWGKPFLVQKLGPGSPTTVGIPIAIGVIVLSWVLTGVYIFWANNTYDTAVKRLKERFGG